MERAGTGEVSLRLDLHRLEACWWMLRPPGFYVKSSIAVAGWLVAPGHPGYARMIAIVVALGLSGGVVNVINDVLDREKDKVTAPELPLPSGMVTLPWAAGLLAVLAAGVLVCVGLASISVERFALGLVPLLGAGVVVGAYSLLKPVWFGPPLLAAMIYALMPLDAWVVAGAGGGQIAYVLGFAVCFGIAANFLAALRDVAADPGVGNRSIAVRFGVDRVLGAASLADLGAVVCAAALARARGELGAAAVWALLTALVVGAGYAWAWRRRGRTAAGRDAGLVSLRPANFARWTSVVLVVGVLSVPVALVVAAAITLSFGLLIPAYRRRIMQGQLRAAMAA
jgi:4-hydroxybenzoate polyprenyltransferase